MAQDLLPGLIDQSEVDWPRVSAISYLVQQRFRYEYPAPIHDLRHRLVIVPPDRHGDQRAVVSHVRASSGTEPRRWTDEHGNVVIEFSIPRVEAAVEFEARIAVERRAPGEGPRAAAGAGARDRLVEPTRLTGPASPLVAAARRLRRGGRRGLALAEAVNRWTHRALTYRHGVTDVGTTAAEALALGHGVCQDYAHVMLAVCRLLGIPARYVSGHLLGEGGTHAWVEVLEEGGDGARAVAFDPTHGRRAGLRHVTVATGRDYRDVAPTSGRYLGDVRGRLSTGKRVDITRLEHGRRGRLSA
jgi:transglutaminase-like putative cysteine protease